MSCPPQASPPQDELGGGGSAGGQEMDWGVGRSSLANSWAPGRPGMLPSSALECPNVQMSMLVLFS